MTPLRLTKTGKACKSHHHCQLWRSHSSLQLEEYVHKTASHIQGATGFIPNQELREKQEAHGLSVLCYLARDVCLQSCTPTQTLHVVLVTLPVPCTAFPTSHREKIHPSLHGSCCWLQWCAHGDELLHICEVLVVWNAHASSVVG